MDAKDTIQTLVTYGKGPFLRYAVVLLMGLLSKFGISDAQAGNFATAAWELLAPLLVAAGLWVWGVYTRKALHETMPPDAVSTDHADGTTTTSVTRVTEVKS